MCPPKNTQQPHLTEDDVRRIVRDELDAWAGEIREAVEREED